MMRCWCPREAHHECIYLRLSSFVVRSILIWVVKCMCVSCELLKYIYGLSIRS